MRRDDDKVRVMVVGADLPLRYNLACLLEMEPDLEVRQCGRVEASELASTWNPHVIVLSSGNSKLLERLVTLTPAIPIVTMGNGNLDGVNNQVICLDGLASYDTALTAIRQATQI